MPEIMTEIAGNKFMTIEQAAKYLRIPRTLLWRMCEKGEAPGSKHGQRWIFKEKWLKEWIATGMKPEISCDVSNPKIEVSEGYWVLYYLINKRIEHATIAPLSAYATKEEAERAALPLIKRLNANEWRAIEPEPSSAAYDRVQYTTYEYQQQLVKQGGKCSICQSEPPRLNWDHDHISGDPRELLCPSCNQGLGMFKDDPKRLEAAAAYLRRFGR